MTGTLIIGPQTNLSTQGGIIGGTLKSVLEHDLEHETISAEDMAIRYPMLKLDPATEVALFETDGAVLVPEMCIAAYQREAIEHGACLYFNDGLNEWNYNKDTDTYVLITENGKTFQAKKLVFAVGAWAGDIYGSSLPFKLRVERRVVHWFKPPGQSDGLADGLAEEAFVDIPVYIWETDDGSSNTRSSPLPKRHFKQP